MERPKIVCLCGSTKFLDQFDEHGLRLTLEGKIVLSIGTHRPISRRYADGLDDKKKLLDKLHFSKIELADSIFVINVGGYIGHSTRNEINHAIELGKKVEYLEDHS